MVRKYSLLIQTDLMAPPGYQIKQINSKKLFLEFHPKMKTFWMLTHPVTLKEECKGKISKPGFSCSILYILTLPPSLAIDIFQSTHQLCAI